jgi:hypothetical protein
MVKKGEEMTNGGQIRLRLRENGARLRGGDLGRQLGVMLC